MTDSPGCRVKQTAVPQDEDRGEEWGLISKGQSGPVGVAPLVGLSSVDRKVGCRFDSRFGHRPRL